MMCSVMPGEFQMHMAPYVAPTSEKSLFLTRLVCVLAGKGANSGVGFAIPIDGTKGLVEQILQYGKVVRPILGITIAPPQVSLVAALSCSSLLLHDLDRGLPGPESQKPAAYA